jgi:hypothetical protein
LRPSSGGTFCCLLSKALSELLICTICRAEFKEV